MLFVFAILIFLLVSLLIVLKSWSPGKPLPILDESGKPVAGSISEKLRIDINGVEQRMFIKGKESTKPVLLYLHGGMPDYFITQQYPTRLEEDFVVVWWDQRGAGMSYHPGMDVQRINTAVLVQDIITLTNYLKQRFAQEKIYLVGHSGGTFIGLHAVSKAPGLFRAYIGVSQASNQLRSEKLAYDYMLQQFKLKGDKHMVKSMEAAPVTETNITNEYLSIRDKAMHQLGVGTMRNMHSVVPGLFFPSLQFKEYTITDKLNLWRGKAAAGVSVVWKEMIQTDLKATIPRVEVPVYFLHGVYDYTCSYAEAKSYFNHLQAPLKGFYTFEEAAHSPLFEDAARMQTIMREDVLKGKVSLADTQ